MGGFWDWVNVICMVSIYTHVLYTQFYYPKWWKRKREEMITELKAKHGEFIFVDLEKNKIMSYRQTHPL